jgi:hypothetical protein
VTERTFPNEPVGFDALPGWIWEVGEKQDANLRHALRIAKPNAAERIAFDIDQVAAEMRLAVAKLDDLEQVRKPLSTSKRFVQQTMDEITGLIENSALDTRVAWGTRPPRPGHRGRPGGARRGNLEDGDRRRCVNRSDSVSSWLRR